MKKNISIFISDEGYGHTIRQRTIIKELLKRKKFGKITVFHEKNLKILKETFKKKINYRKIFNNLKTIKNNSGHLDINKTLQVFKNWETNHHLWVRKITKEMKDTDIIISDFVPEAFEIGKILKINSYGVCHYTWDWFYKKILRRNKTNNLTKYAHQANRIFFPPITENQILKKYKKNAVSVNFFLSDFKRLNIKKKNICVLMDNGTRSNLNNITKSLKFIKNLKNINFYINAENLKKTKEFKLYKNSKNLNFVYGIKKIHNMIRASKFIIARGGFNTLSESLVLKIPGLLVEEKNNPEIKSNINYLKKYGLTYELKIKDMKENIEKTILFFLKHKYNKIKDQLIKANYKSNGAKQVVDYIIKENKID